ncbi:MAG TPA: 1-deoxy-D-xylulose-5-phosphate synthase [Gammaproteobacteria bacterium]|nr:1-deoxy-D-xylulose-5-phosphate synthase [Gammaproteobacteria bacterium]
MLNYPLLDQIESPKDLRQLTEQQLPQLADELREFILGSVSKSGGHLASGLGVVELTIALHYIYNTPDDRLVWDVGHQCYPHKILTGRKHQLASIRQKDGLAGFPKREESEFDDFGVGHSSTSISAALGMAIASHRQGEQRKAVAIIGDGAMTAGMAFEALNHAGDLHEDLLVILNDNDMSISPNVGGLSNYMSRVLSSHLFTSVREEGKRILKHLPPIEDFARKAEGHMKGMVTPGTLFEELGFNYIGPVDGHDLPTLTKTLRNIRDLKGPILLHAITRKGKGYHPAEQEPNRYHGVGQFDPITGITPSSKPGKKTYTEVFSDWLCDQAIADKRLLGITPAMREGSGLVEFSQRFPDRYFDVAIAEQHAVTLAAGLACDGMKPVIAIYSTFLQRAYDQLIHDVAIQNLPVLFAVDRAGLVGPDGPTHAGSFDLAYLRCIPNLTIMAPTDERECRQMLSTGFQLNNPAVVRYPRGAGTGVDAGQDLTTLEVGKGTIVKEGKNIAFLVFGSPLSEALKAAESLQATVVNMRFVKPLDESLISTIASNHDTIVTLEDGVIAGGAGSAVAELLNRNNLQLAILHLGLPDHFQEHGSREELLGEAGLQASDIVGGVRRHLDMNSNNSNNTQTGSRWLNTAE